VTSRAPSLVALPGGASEDAALVASAIAGNERAFATLYRRHARYVAGVVYRLMGSDAELDDVVQEAFVDASRALASLEDPAGLRGWLATIAVRRVHKRFEKRRRWRWLVVHLEHVGTHVSEPRAREPVDALYEVLDTLPPDLRVPWSLHAIEGETLPEVAKLCGVSLATVKRRIADAAERIQRKLGEPR
jgi:RNA polymerase sigma-70 factor (ECF subfamily)